MKRRLASILPLALILAGCAGPIETRISSSGQAAIEAQKITLAPLPPHSSNVVVQARDLAVAALQQHGFMLDKDADIQLNVAISDRPAELAVKNGDEILARAKKQKLMQNCKDREYTAMLTLTRISDGAQLYVGDAAEYHCKATLSETLPILMDALADDIVAASRSKRQLRMGKD